MANNAFYQPVCYTGLYDERIHQIAPKTVQPSFCSIADRASFPQVYIGYFADGSMEVDPEMVDIFVAAINTVLLQNHDKLSDLSSWELENALPAILNFGHCTVNGCKLYAGFWSSRRHPLDELGRSKPQLPPQRRSSRRPPKKHIIADKVDRIIENERRGKRREQVTHHKVSKPLQERVAPLRAFMEYSETSKPFSDAAAEKRELQNAEKIFDRLLENIRRQDAIENAKAAEEILQPDRLTEIGSLTLSKGKELCQWAKDKYNCGLFQVTLAADERGEYKVLMPVELLPKIKRAIRSKFKSIKAAKVAKVKVAVAKKQKATKKTEEKSLIDLMVEQERQLRNAASKGKRFSAS